MNCVICFEQNDLKFKTSSPAVFKCYTCNDGFVCNSCIADFDPYGSIFLKKIGQVKKTIKCPCCRTLNWNYHFNQIIQITLEEPDEHPKNAVSIIVIRNKYNG